MDAGIVHALPVCAIIAYMCLHYVITPEDYKRYAEAEENFALYLEAVGRMKRDDGERLSMKDAFGEDYRPVDDGFDPEFE